MSRSDVTAEKAAWRERFRSARQQRTPTARGRASAEIIDRLQALPEMGHAEVVHLFWPLPGEVDLRPLADALRQSGRTVALPVVDGPRLVHREYRGRERLVPGPWGLQEPDGDAPAIGEASIDLIIVPALALGRDGTRLGYGGGYYDAFLPITDARCIGVVPAYALVPSVPTEPHDARVEIVVTDADTIRVGGP